MDDEYEDVFYRPTPEGELRIMGTTAEFLCQGGYTLTAQCMADGNWSRGIPSEEECSLKSKLIKQNIVFIKYLFANNIDKSKK